jgi:hypothetical protein
MSKADQQRALAELAMNTAHAKDVMLRAILLATKDVDNPRLDHWALRDRLRSLRRLAEQIRDTGTAAHEPALLVLEDDDDYESAHGKEVED